MANTSLSLGEPWEVFIKNEIASGRYGSTSEVVRDALAEGEAQARDGKFVKQYSVDTLLTRADEAE